MILFARWIARLNQLNMNIVLRCHDHVTVVADISVEFLRVREASLW